MVIVGKAGWQMEDLLAKIQSHAEIDRQLFWLKGIDDDYLTHIYAASTCLISASEGEGFGLPLIEAAQHKLPIIARDIPVFREVACEHAYYFKGKDPETLAEAIKSWLALYETGRHPSTDQMSWLTWKESAAQLKQVVMSMSSKKGY